MTEPALVGALIEETTKKSSAILWLIPVLPGATYDDLPRPHPAWSIWYGGCAYVLHGPGEQPAPGLDAADVVWVSVRSKERWGRLLTWEAEAAPVEPRSDEWAAVVPLLLGARLNLPDGEAAAERWAESATVTRLRPTGELVESLDDLPSDSEAAPPPDTPAITPVRVPFTVGRATRRRPRPRRGR